MSCLLLNKNEDRAQGVRRSRKRTPMTLTDLSDRQTLSYCANHDFDEWVITMVAENEEVGPEEEAEAQ